MRGLTASKCSMSAMLVTHRNAKEARIEEEYHSPESLSKVSPEHGKDNDRIGSRREIQPILRDRERVPARAGAVMHRSSHACQPELRELERAEAVAQDLRAIYRADTVETAEHELNTFSKKLDARYPTIARYGSGTGNGGASRSWPTRPRFAASSTPRMRWNL